MSQPFQAEVRQLLDLVIHSLYTDREIFVRELVSNAADALEKLRHLQLTHADLVDPDRPLEISLTTDEEAGTFTLQDAGVGLTRAELQDHLGTIAKSGTKAFLQAARDAAASGESTPPDLIGQFGVGFYSAFMVAQKVSVYTRSWQADGESLLWTSDGGGAYDIESTDDVPRGAKIVIQLKDDAKEFANPNRLRGLLRRYSSFVPFPILLNGERVNTVQALWRKRKDDITDADYTEFYKFQAHAFDEPRSRLHFTADAPLSIHALLFVPQENTERLGLGRQEPGVALHCRKILIDAHPEGLLPPWLRFLRGVVDSDDLPLNVSRETMQDSALLRKLNQVITRKFLRHLEDEAKRDETKYREFYAAFHPFLKEGIITDHTHQAELAKLLRFESSALDAGTLTSLDEVVSRLGADAKEIPFLIGRDRATLEASPVLEAFRRRSREVIFLYEPVDELVLNHLGTFAEKRLASADRADFDLAEIADDAAGTPLPEEQMTGLCSHLATVLGARFAEVKASRRLADSPAVALNADAMFSPGLRRLLRQGSPDGEDAEGSRFHLEINPRHPLVHRIAELQASDPALADLLGAQLADNALLSAGFLEDPRTMVSRLQSLLERVAGVPAAAATVDPAPTTDAASATDAPPATDSSPSS